MLSIIATLVAIAYLRNERKTHPPITPEEKQAAFLQTIACWAGAFLIVRSLRKK